MVILLSYSAMYWAQVHTFLAYICRKSFGGARESVRVKLTTHRLKDTCVYFVLRFYKHHHKLRNSVTINLF